MHVVRHRPSRLIFIPFLALWTVAPGAGLLTAQSPTALRGRVLEAETGNVLADVVITVIGTNLSTKTDRSGSYRLESLPAGEVRLRLERRDYATVVESFDWPAGTSATMDFRMTPLAVVLDRVLVRGGETAPDPTEVELDPVRFETALQALDRTVPGATIFRPGGQVGAGMGIVIRGLKSFTQRNDPLIFLDGVRVSDPNVNVRGQRGLSILEMIDPQQIDRIEVLTGPDAAIRYGLGAGNGVILIYTR